MTRVTQAGQNGGNAVAEKRVDFAYDALNRFNTITRYANTAGTSLVATSDYTFNNAGDLTALSHVQNSTTLASYTWAFDKLHRVTQFVSSTDGTVDYSYDSTSQLTGADYNYQTDESYSYDLNGNRTNTGYSTGDNNRLTSDGTYNYEYEYDNEGNRTRRVHIATNVSTEYTWDHRNRLTKIVEKNGSGVVQKTTDYAYDLFDRRVSRTITPAVGPAEVEKFFYDGEHIALRFENGQVANRYLHGPAIDQILADEQVTSTSSSGNVLWALTDNLGTVRDLAQYSSGVTSAVNHLKYDSFGKITSESNAAVDHLFAYTGRERDEESGLYYYRARYYDPAVGRFVSEDPIGFAAGDGNLARYVGNSATTFTDPSGLVAAGKAKEKPVEKVEIDRSDDGSQRIYVRQAPAEELREMGLSKSQVNDACECQYIGDTVGALHDTLGFQRGEVIAREFVALYEGDEVVGAVLVMSTGQKTWYGLPHAVKDKNGKWQIIGYTFYDDTEWLKSDYAWYKSMRLFMPLMSQAAINAMGLLGVQGSPARQSRGLRLNPCEADDVAGAGSRVTRPGSISGNPSNRLVETGKPLKSGDGWARRWIRMTEADELAQRRAIANRYDELLDEATKRGATRAGQTRLPL